MTILNLLAGDFLLSRNFFTHSTTGSNFTESPVVLSRSFNSPQTITGLKFFIDETGFNSLISDGSLFVGKEVTALGLFMRISGFKVLHYPVHGFYRVEVNLASKHAQTGSKVVSKRCELDKPIYVNSRVNSQGYVYLSQLGTYLRETGISDFKIPFPDATDEEFTSWREQATKYEENYKCFFDYDGEYPHARKWVTGRTNRGELTALYSNPDKAQEIILGGSGSFLNGVQLVKELVNAKFEINVEKPAENVEKTIHINADANAQASQLGLTNEHFRNSEQCFDKGGPTIVEQIIEKLNDTILSEVYYTWGFKYDTMQTHSMNQADEEVWFNITAFSYTSFWQIVKTETITYNFDINDDTYIGKTHNVSEQVRLLEDSAGDDDSRRHRYMRYLNNMSSDPETASLNLDYYNLMNFTNQSYSFVETIELGDMQDFYADITWQLVTSKKNPKPRYNRKRIYKGGYILSALDPQSELDENAKDTPDATKIKKLVKGQTKYEKNTVEILVPGGRIELQQTPEFYLESDYQFTNEGEDFGRGRGKPETKEVEGRPPIASRLVDYGNVHGSVFIPDANNVYMFNTLNTGFNSFDPITETVSYDGIFRRSEAVDIAEFILSKENTFGCKVYNLSNVKNVGLSWKPGDLCTFNGDLCVIEKFDLSIVFNPELRQWELLDNQTSMTIGKLMQPTVSQNIKFS